MLQHMISRRVSRSMNPKLFMRAMSGQGFLAQVPMGPPDPIFGIVEAYNKDPSPEKLNFSVGAYRDDDGKPVVLDSVREAERRVVDQKLNMEYAPMGGQPTFVRKAMELIYPEKDIPRVAAVQTLSGTGSLRMAGQFVMRVWGGDKPTMYLPDPTWGNHIPIFEHAGMTVKKHRYYDPNTKGLDYKGMIEDIEKAPEGSMFLLHAAAHNPTGVDPTPEQWKGISTAIKSRGHFALFDNAYQGFATGDFNKDKIGITQFMEDNHTFFVCQSFAKNFGLYGQRVGCISALCANEEDKKKVQSQLQITARAMYSNPPIHGARIVETILSDPDLKNKWLGEVKAMSERIILMRQMLHDGIKAEGSTHNWQHVLDQIGMFTYSGLTKAQCEKLRDDWHIHMTLNGRISMAGVTTKNVGRLSKAIHAVTK